MTDTKTDKDPVPAESAPKPDAPRPKVMVVDDELGFRELVSRVFQDDYDVVTAADGEEAVRRAGARDIDVVISDMTMPKLSGLEALKAMKEIDPKIEVILVTGYATLETAIESMKLGAYDYITKPFDIEELVRLVARALDKRRLSRQVNELQELNRFKSEFLANMSHELRTPMNAILGYTSLHLDRLYGEITQKQEDALKRVEAAGKNLLHLINSILDLSKISAGRMPVYLEEFHVKDLIDEVTSMMDCLARAKQLKLEAYVPKDMRVRSDKTKLKQILINLVNNGIKFTSSGGIFIAVDRSLDQPFFNIRVRDTGIGIKADDLPVLFQEFKQLDASPTREYGGTGLGLVISRKFAQLMGGDIVVESAAGTGSTFTVTLPLESGQQEQAAENIFQPAAAVRRGKVFLAIDDDPEVLTLLRDSLQGSGYEFAGALGAEEGIAMARELKPFAITLDIMMPHKDGWSALQIMKNDPELRKIPVIILSIMDNKTLGYALGVTDYILKPFERVELLKKLKTLDRGAPEGSSPKKTPHTILVADDEKPVADYLKETLGGEGYAVETAEDGAAALKSMSVSPPDILFLDLMMPEINGFELIAKMEKDPKLKNVSIFILTARHLTPEETDYLQKRTEAVIQKGSQNLSDILGLVKKRLKTLEAADER
ncbi:MAG: hypothetical protein A2X28_01370 [Elusimicrobia bacterium GWA2_56_46]|nr:MAG: hypothetical protein A2X28_01370 [Elusimicrobia bacterium GWA2_56_46]OGR53807.1 MAG: hypothetical protein A2X39_06770 [Elusimicrobia bacterium GWC2_56_31]HBB68042.1 hypothetical protein [Elusimicrobiota bacterium]HBW22659.1 hypothetical protein [Elusimicrobiota bacterium]